MVVTRDHDSLANPKVLVNTFFFSKSGNLSFSNVQDKETGFKDIKSKRKDIT